MKITIEGGVYARLCKDYDWQSDFFFLEGGARDWSGGKLLAAHTIEVEVPYDLYQRSVEVIALEKKRKAVRDAAASEVREIDQRINSLLASELKRPPVEPSEVASA